MLLSIGSVTTRSENFHTYLKIATYGVTTMKTKRRCVPKIMKKFLERDFALQKTLKEPSAVTKGSVLEQTTRLSRKPDIWEQVNLTEIVRCSRGPTSEHNQAVFVIKQNREVFHR